MNLHILGTGSRGNQYIIQNDHEALIIEFGTNFKNVLKAVDFNLKKIAGGLLSHCHQDHSKFARQAMDYGVKVYSSAGTFKALNLTDHPRAETIECEEPLMIGSFMVKPFDVVHDAPEPFGFLIYHPETGLVLFLTDTWYSDYVFQGLSQMIIEANYSEEVLEENLRSGRTPGFLANRITESHQSIESALHFFELNDMSKVKNIVVIHLSDSNSNAKDFKDKIEANTGIEAIIADKDMIIPFNVNPF